MSSLQSLKVRLNEVFKSLAPSAEISFMFVDGYSKRGCMGLHFIVHFAEKQRNEHSMLNYVNLV